MRSAAHDRLAFQRAIDALAEIAAVRRAVVVPQAVAHEVVTRPGGAQFSVRAEATEQSFFEAVVAAVVLLVATSSAVTWYAVKDHTVVAPQYSAELIF